MKNFSFGIFNIIALLLITLFAVCAFCPFNFVDMEQAQRIAKWKSEYEQYNYCFSLVDIHEGFIAEEGNLDEKTANEILVSRIKPYFNLSEEKPIVNKKYKYKRKNGTNMPKYSYFYFDNFLKSKNGSLISFKKNTNTSNIAMQPLYYMFIDINGEAKPNRVGQDIFFISIFPHEVQALGYDKNYSKLKQNCSLGSGVYCSEFYLLGGHF